ncbi:hypothetical protein SDC9_204445 [bioreactor metagenome]|uniref:Uncharacterized protein n=1 Tax=bioreactor metagenome TaxID=1076179 RepID=A0A645JB64_9ZZZZ
MARRVKIDQSERVLIGIDDVLRFDVAVDDGRCLRMQEHQRFAKPEDEAHGLLLGKGSAALHLVGNRCSRDITAQEIVGLVIAGVRKRLRNPG